MCEDQPWPKSGSNRVLASAHTGEGDSFDKALLGEDIDQEHRQESDDGAGHEQVPVGVVLAAEGGQTDRNRAGGVGVGDDQGQRKSFHEPRKTKIVSAASTGLLKGMMTCAQIRKEEAPSMRAASSSSTGIPRKY